MKEIIIYGIAAIAAVTVFGYTVHMFIGGLVSPETEKTAIIIACILASITIGLMAWDISKRRQQKP